MKKYLLGLLAIASIVAFSAFMKKDESSSQKIVPPSLKLKEKPAVNKEEPEAGVWVQFIGSSWDWNSVHRCDNWIEFTGDPAWLCNNVNQKACAMEVKVSALTGTAPNRRLTGIAGGATSATIYFNFYVTGTYYVFMPGPSDVLQFRNRS